MYHWFPGARVPSDIDLLTPAKISGNNSKVCVVDAQWHDAAQLLIDSNKDPVFLDPNLLFTLKVSHAEWDVKWEKTMFDIHFLKSQGCELDLPILKMLHKAWSNIHGKKKVNMAQSMDTFFSDHVKREYDHEHLHQLVKFNDRPVHELLRPDNGTAWCSEELFNLLSPAMQFECALEEMLATAIERSRLQLKNTTADKRVAMSRAHKQLCVSMTTGWFCRFLILNRNELLHKGKEKWLTKLNQALTVLQKN